jgi:hypothetical protein
MPVSRGRKKKKDKKSKARANRGPATGVLLEPELAVEVLLGVPPDLVLLYALLWCWQTMTAGKPANTCTSACLSLQAALARFDIESEPRVVLATVTGPQRAARVGSQHPRWNGKYWDGHMVLVLPQQGRFIDMTLHQARVLPRTGHYAAPIVGRYISTGRMAMVPGDTALLQRGDYTVRYDVLDDQGSWQVAPMTEADQAGLRENADNVVRLTLDLLRNDWMIDKARQAPHPKLHQLLGQRPTT